MKYTHVIWDFNGTIFDDVNIGIEAVNAMLTARRMAPVDSVEKYREIFCFPIKEYYRRCGFDFEAEDYESILAPEWVREYKLREHTAHLCDGVKEALEFFSSHGIKQSVVSASKQDTLLSQINRLGISRYFEDIVGCNNFYAYGKQDILCEFTERNNSDKLVLIGDTEHDADVAKVAGIDCVLMLTGHASAATLEKCGCNVYDNAMSFAKTFI